MTNQNKCVILLLLAAADRSGEADFLRMLDSCARLRHVEISINKGIRDRTVDALQSDVRWWIRMAEPNVFRMSIGDYWGSDYPTVTSDGRTLMLAGQITTLDKAPPRIIGIGGSFARGGGTYNPLFDFMRGREAASLASPTGDIVKTSSGFRFDSREMGVVDVVLTKRDGLWLPLIIDVSNVAGRMASYRDRKSVV